MTALLAADTAAVLGHVLSAGLTDEDAPGVAQCFRNLRHGFLHGRVILCSLLISHADILQYLRIDFQRCCQLTHWLFLSQHDFHHLETGQDAVTGAGVLREDDMTALLAADTAAVLSHVLVDVLVAHSSLGVANALLIERLVEAKVGHNSRDYGVVHQLAVLLHVAAVDVQNVVAGDDIAFLVHAQAAVSVAVKCKTNVQSVLYHELLQPLNMSRASVVVDVQAVRLVVDDIGIRTQSIKNRLSDIPACTVGAVQTNLHALEGIDAQRDQITHIAVTACHIVHSASDVLAVSKGQLRPILIEHMELTIDVVLHQQQGLFGHLLTVAVDQLDAVIVVGVVAGRDHNAAIKVIYTSNVSHGRRSSNVQQVGICAGSSQTSDQTILEHIRATAGILANDDAGRLVVAVALAQCIVVPAEEATYLVGMVSGQINTSFTTEAISSKILSHYSFASF